MTSLTSRAKKILALFDNHDGTTAVEYAMMVMLVFLAVLSAVTLFGLRTGESFQESSNSLQDVLNPRP